MEASGAILLEPSGVVQVPHMPKQTDTLTPSPADSASTFDSKSESDSLRETIATIAAAATVKVAIEMSIFFIKNKK